MDRGVTMAYTLSFTTTNVSLTSYWSKNGSTVTSHATTATASRTISVSGIPNNAIIQSAVVTTGMRGAASYGTNYEISTLNGTTCNSSGGDSLYTNSVSVTVTGNGDITLTFVYKANEYVGTAAGAHDYSFNTNFENITLTVTYTLPGPPSVSSGWYTLSASNTGSLSGATIYVVGYSKIYVDFNPSKVTPQGSATIASFSITYNGTTQTQNYSSGHVYITSTNAVTGTSSSITLKVTDSAGQYTTATASISAYTYSQPTITNASVYRSTSGKVESASGTYITAKATRNYAALGTWNTCTLKAKYKPQGGSFSTAVDLTDNTLTLINSSALSAQTTYIVRIEATDRMGNTASYEQTIYATATPPVVSSGWYTCSAYNTGTAVADYTGYAVGYSKVSVAFDPTKVTVFTGASIASFSITYNGTTTTQNYSSGTVTIRSGVVGSTSSSILVKVTDSNGLSTTATKTITAYAYSKPTITGISIYRSDSSKAADEDGAYITVKGTKNFSSLNSWNTCTLTAQYKAASSSTYGTAVSLTDNTLTIINSSAVSTSTSYDVKLTATDRAGNTATYVQRVNSKAYPLHIKTGGTGIAFGKMAETASLLDSAWDMKAPLIEATDGFRTGSANQSILRAGAQNAAFIPNLPSGVSYGRVLKFGPDVTTNIDRYYLFLKNPGTDAMRLYIGYQSINSATVRWFMLEAPEVT